MVHMSKALSAGKAQAYYRSELSAAENSYYTQGKQLQGQWHGRFAQELDLVGAVSEEHFDRMAQGQNPATGQQWVGYRDTIRTQAGKEMEHRAGFDLTFNAPKTVSLIALPGHDDRVRTAHDASVKAALETGQEYMQARMGGDRAAQTTGKWAAALFEHDTARPEKGYPAPHLHTHVVLFNMTRTEDGQVRSMQPAEIFRIQSFMTSVYQNELAARLKSFGYELAEGKNHAPEIKGFTKEYLDAESQRSQRIKLEMEERGLEGRKAEEKIAHSARDAKLHWTPEEVHAAHRAHQQEFGGQADKLVAESLSRQGRFISTEHATKSAAEAISFAKEKLSERTSVFDSYELYREALWHRQGSVQFEDIKKEVATRIENTEMQAVSHVRSTAPGERFTTTETIGMERDLVRTIIATKETKPQLEKWTAQDVAERFPQLNKGQQTAVQHITSSRDQFGAFQGFAGAGKTSTLRELNKTFAEHGFEVRGLAPTSGAAKELAAAGVEATTLQMHLTKQEQATKPRYYIVDESSLASTKQVYDLAAGLRKEDRVLFVGDTRQHQSVEAGRIFAELREAGMASTTLRQIVRQQDPKLLEAVTHLSEGRIGQAVRHLVEQGRVHEVSNKNARYEAIAVDYVKSEGKVLVVSPDNECRKLLNGKIREALQESGRLGTTQYSQDILVARHDLTKEDRKVAAAYHEGDVIKFHKANKTIGVAKGEYLDVRAVDANTNTLTVRTASGSIKSYQPDRAYGVQVYERQRRQYAEGERVQLTAPWKEKGLANRQVGTLEYLDPAGNAVMRLDDNHRVKFNLKQMKHLDHGYAVTSYSAQGATVDKVIVQISTSDTRVRSLVDQRLAYVAISRARHDVQIYTDSIEQLPQALKRQTDKSQALHPDEVKGYREKAVEIRQQKKSISYGF